MGTPRNLSKLAENTDSSGVLGIASGGTGGSTAAAAKSALNLHAVASSGSYADLNNKPTTANITEDTNLYYTDARARAAVSATGSLSYNSTTGVFSYTTPSTSGITEGTNLYFTDARVRAAVSAGTNLSYNSTTGVFSTTLTQYTDALARAAVSAGTGLSYNSTTGVFSTSLTQYTDALARAAVSASGSLSYNSTTGVFSYTTPSTSGIAEGSNLYYTDARARAAHSAGTGISYNSTTGAISSTITQYTDALARAAVSAGTGLSYNSSTGVFTNTITQYTDALAVSANTSAIATAKSEAIASAATDATNKANAAQAAAISAVTNGAGAAFDTLKEIQDAMATDAELAAAIASITVGNATQTISAGTGLSGGGSFTANQTAASTVTLSLGTAGTSGTYTKVTTDAYGRVTSGTTLSSGDIPSLSGLYLPLTGGTLTGKVTFPSANANQPQMPGGFLGLDTGDGNFDIWGISRDYYPSNPTAANAWGIRWDGDSNQIRFIGGGSARVAFDLDDGTTQINGNTVLHAANYNSYSPTLTGTGASGTWGISITGTAGAANSATSAGYLTGGDSGFYGLLYNALAGDLNTYNSPGLYSAEYTGSTNKPSVGANGHIIQISDAGGTDVKTQWYFPNGGSPYMRLMWGNTNWNPWLALLTSSNYNSYSPTLTGAGASGTWGINISGNAATASTASLATAAIRIQYNDGPRDLSDRLPNSFTRTVNFDFVGAAAGNGSGNYAGVMTYSPWSGTTASTGDSSYQLAFANTTGVNAAGQPKLSIRNGIDSTWNAWYTLLHSGNVGSYALPINGGTISGRVTFQDASDTQITLNGAGTAWTGITATDSGGTDNLWIYGATGTWTFGGGGSPISGKKMHIHGGVTIGSGYTQTSNPSNGLNVEGAIQQAGNQVLHAGNYTSYSPSLTGSGASGTWGISITGNAATAGGLAVHTARNDQVNQIVRTDANGYIQAGWINTTSGDSGIESRLTRIYSSNDNYVRYSTLTDFKVHMGLSAKNSYSRRIDYTSDANYHVGSMGHNGYGANETFHGGSGFFDIWGGTNYPPSTSHIHGFNALHYTTNSLGSTGGNAYGIQVAGQYDQGGLLFSRACNGGSFTSWRRQIDDNNYSSYALPLSGGTLTGTLYFTDTTNGFYKSGGRLNVRSESTDNVAEYASYGLYLPKSGHTAGLYVESPIEARGGLRLGSGASNGTITVGSTTDATANRLVQRDGSGHINAAYVFGTYFNSNAGNSENPTIGQVWTQSTGDNYLRKSTPAHFISQLGLLTTSNYSSYALPLSGGTVGDLRTNFTSGGGGHTFSANHYSMGKDIANGTWSHPHYSDLIIGYHTGIRLGAAYSGIRFYNNSPTTDANNDGNGDGGEALLMTVGGHAGGSNVIINNNLWLSNSNLSLGQGDGTALRVTTAYGYMNFGPQNTSWCHLYSDRPFYTNQGIWINNNRVLDASNYTSYSPSLGGSGASGTWAINVTGSAGSSNVMGSSGYGNGTHTWRQDSGTFAGYSGWASYLISNHGDGDTYYSQTIIMPFWSAPQYSRKQGSSAVVGPYVFLTTENYTSYSPTLTGGSASGTWGIAISGNAARATRANGNFYIDDNYGNGIVGVYSSYRYQGVFAMGDSYKLAADGTTTGSLYGMAWSHPNAGGAAGNLTDHGLLIINAGAFKCAISNSIVASANITAYSDERLKTNWRSMPDNFVARLAQVKVGIYDRIDEEDTTQVGVSAQSFQELLPQAIMTAKDEMGTLSVSYGNAALASAVELAKEVVDLKTRVAQLEALINKLIKD